MSDRRPAGRRTTAAELAAELAADPAHQDRGRSSEAERAANLAAYGRAMGPVLSDLSAAGIEVAAVAEVGRREGDFVKALPVLIRWLPRVSYCPAKQELVHTLSSRWAGPAAGRALLDALRETDDPDGTGLRWAIASALSSVADASLLDELAALVKDASHGQAREMLTLALANIREPRAVALLIELLDDEVVVGHAAIALGRLRAGEARGRLEALGSSHPKSWVRQEARKALTRITSPSSAAEPPV